MGDPVRRAIVGLVVVAVSSAGTFASGVSFEERVRGLIAVEQVLDSRGTGAGGRSPGVPFQARLSEAAVRRRVERTLRQDSALRSWGIGITPADLQRELHRMAAGTRDPALLRELHRALGDDPLLVAECLARPALTERRFAPRFEALDAAEDQDAWLARSFPALDEPEPADFHLPSITGFAGSGLLGGEGPEARFGHTAVWTGSEMIIWGGYGETVPSSGWRYRPSTDAWLPISSGEGSPSSREGHDAFWTGSEMVVWGGGKEVGGRYDPATDSWRAIPPGPSRRNHDSAVWTGRFLVVWGGLSSYPVSVALDTGARYEPATGAWTPTSMAGVPRARRNHAAVWTGSEMIVWGGADVSLISAYGDGGRYDPATDTWRPMSGFVGLVDTRAVWTGSSMMVWGGEDGGLPMSAGGSYDPVLDRWTGMAASPLGARVGHSAVWTGSRFVVFGGRGASFFADGAAYDPSSGVWAFLGGGASAPVPRADHAAVWTGSEMIVWGGQDGDRPIQDGARHVAATGSWRPMASRGYVPSDRGRHVAIWTGTEMIVWGGETRLFGLTATGGAYAPVMDAWRPIARAGAPEAREHASAVWTGSEMIVWGGQAYLAELDTGGRYDPLNDAWRPTAVGTGTPSPRELHSAVWTGSVMVVWGGYSYYTASGARFRDGGRYDPASDSWAPTSLQLATPSARLGHGAVWTGSEMVVWGGYSSAGVTGDGGRYDPVSDAWRPVPIAGAPAARRQHATVWTGSEMIVWGGDPATTTGGRYDPSQNVWRATSATGSPEGRWNAACVWTGTEMVIWGGGYSLATGGRYDPALDRWRATSRGANVPAGRRFHTAVWTGTEMIVWGGTFGGGPGGRYDPLRDSWSVREVPLLGDDVVAAKSGVGPLYDTRIATYRVDGTATPAAFQIFPWHPGAGVVPAAGDVDRDLTDEIVAGLGSGSTSPPRVRAFEASGIPVAQYDVHTYATPGYGANATPGRIEASVVAITGPGPSAAYGPLVRAFFRNYNGWMVPLAKVSFFAYGTPRYGVGVAAGHLDADAYEEIVTGAGPGVVFGPHVRGFDYDGAAVSAIANVSFFAYATPRYGVKAATGDVDGDGYGEILTGPGPSGSFAPNLRGFDVDGGAAAAIAGINAWAFTGSRYGLHVAAGDLELDGFEEIACGAGPDPGFGSLLSAYDYDGTALADIPALSLDAFGLSYGARVAVGSLGL